MKKILFVAHSGTLNGGGERSLLNLIAHTKQIGKFDIHVSVPFEGAFTEALKNKQIHYSICPISFSVLPRKDDPDVSASRWASVGFADSITAAYTLLLKLKPDLVISNTIVIPWYSRIAKKIGIPNIVFIREIPDERNGVRLAPDKDTYLHSLATTTDLFIYNSEYTRDSYKDALGSNKSIIVYPDVTTPDQKLVLTPLMSTTTRLIIVGNITPHKNQLEAVEALNNLKNHFSSDQLSLTIMGSDTFGTYTKKLNSYIQKYNLSEYVKFESFQDSPYPIMSEHDILLMCSHNEAFGRVTLEGQLLHNLVIAADAGGTREIVEHNSTGLLYTPGDSNDLANKIKWAIDNKELSRSIALKGYKFAKDNFGTNRIYQQFDILLDEAYIFNSTSLDYDQSSLFGDNEYSLVVRNIYMNEKLKEYAESLNNLQIKHDEAVAIQNHPSISKRLRSRISKSIRKK